MGVVARCCSAGLFLERLGSRDTDTFLEADGKSIEMNVNNAKISKRRWDHPGNSLEV